MPRFTILPVICLFLTVLAGTALGAAGYSPVASAGKPVEVEPGWPAGIAEVINDACRTVGWNFWFTECPNDVNHYAFAAKDTDELNRLIKKLAATKAKGMTVALSLGKEFPARGFAFLKPGNNIPAVLGLGNQVRINEWYVRLEEVAPGVRAFGMGRYSEPPTAMPPTLTIYVEHEAVDLEKLAIPAEVRVTASVSKEDREKRKDDAALKAIDKLLERRQRASELR